MESKDDRNQLIATLAKYLNADIKDIGKMMKGDFKPDNEDVTLNDTELQKLVKTASDQGIAILKLTTENLFGKLMASAVDAIAKADTGEAVDLVLTKAKADIVTLKTETKCEDTELFKAFDREVDEDLARRAKERKAKLEAKTSKADLAKFRDTLPEGLHKAFDDLGADDQGKFMESYGKTDEENPMAKALETVTGENATLKKRLDKMEGESDITKAKAEFKDLEGFVDMDKFVASVIKLRDLDADAASEFITQAKAMAAQSKLSGVFKVVGKNGDLETGAEGKLAKAVAAHRVANPDDNEAVATTKVMDADPSLYGDVEDERIAG